MCARLSAFNRIKTTEEILETGEWYREYLSEEENETYHKYLEVFLLENKSIFHKLSNRLRP
jgi:hypothetical protein